jgi:hypothetical protein
MDAIPNVSRMACPYHTERWAVLVETGWVTISTYIQSGTQWAVMLYCPERGRR